MNAWQARLAVRALGHGGLVLHATEGVWGFACDPWNRTAVSRLLVLKGRRQEKGLIVIAADTECFAPELTAIPSVADRETVRASWPDAVTWILPNVRFPAWVTGGRATVAARVPGHVESRDLCRAFGGPLVSTSANRAGRRPARSRIQARALLRDLRRRRLLGPRSAASTFCPAKRPVGAAPAKSAPWLEPA